MVNSGDIPVTLTGAQIKSGYSFVILSTNSTQSTFRTIPYREYYHGRSAVIETPVEHIQKAARDEKARKTKH